MIFLRQVQSFEYQMKIHFDVIQFSYSLTRVYPGGGACDPCNCDKGTSLNPGGTGTSD